MVLCVLIFWFFSFVLGLMIIIVQFTFVELCLFLKLRSYIYDSCRDRCENLALLRMLKLMLGYVVYEFLNVPLMLGLDITVFLFLNSTVNKLSVCCSRSAFANLLFVLRFCNLFMLFQLPNTYILYSPLLEYIAPNEVIVAAINVNLQRISLFLMQDS